MVEALPTPIGFGPYSLHAKIAQGGMSEVFLGTTDQKELIGQFLAIKKLLPHLNSNRPFVNLLIHEAKIGVLLNHPCIVSVYDLGCFQTDFFLAMEYVHGKSLDLILSAIEKQAGPQLGLELSSYIIVEVIRGLAFAHQLKDTKDRELNIIHRDITPGNILVSFLGEVKLADFGIATAENRLLPGFSNTALGKVSYISPEQAVNDPVVKASDIYSLGVVFYQLLTGDLPYRGETAHEVYKKIISGDVKEIMAKTESIPANLRSIILRCLDRSVKNRPQSCPELYTLIQEALKETVGIDFTTRTSRLYYRKKLSEWMRNVFAADMAQDLDITRRALTPPLYVEAFVAQPTGSEESFEAVEATVFEANLTDEVTRHYPTGEIDRQKILAELSNKESAENISEDEPTSEDSQEHSHPGSNISLNDKLRISRLTKDEKENLKERQPQLEITSRKDLENFESKTFSQAKKTPRQTSKPKIVGFKHESTTPAMVLKDTHPSQTMRQSKKFEFKLPSISALHLKRLGISGLVLMAFTMVFVALYFREEISGLFKSSTPSWRESREVFLQVVGEIPQAQLEQLFGKLNSPEESPNLRELEDLFHQEFKRYTQSKADRKILIFENSNYPVSTIDGISKQPNISELLGSDLLFSFFKDKGLNPTSNHDWMVYVYFYPIDSKTHLETALPEGLPGIHKPGPGVIFVPADPSQRLKTLFALAREVAKIFGATEKTDSITHMPIFPQGFANPKENPLYPQPKAELMGKVIPTSSIQMRNINSLKEISIGPQTAYEFGWIGIDTRDRLLK